jgi:hypothetical protein
MGQPKEGWGLRMTVQGHRSAPFAHRNGWPEATPATNCGGFIAVSFDRLHGEPSPPMAIYCR